MDRHREKASTLFTRLTHGLSRKRPPTIDQSPASQTSPIFKLPDELILSTLSYISPDPDLSGDYARFRMPYSVGISNCHNKRAEFLRPLSMTCRAMRLRLLPWVWECLEVPPRPLLALKERALRKLNTIVNDPYTGKFLATNVKFVKVRGPLLPLFVKCLESLPNLHTLEIWGDSPMTTSLEEALKPVKLPQVETLILPPTAHPTACPRLTELTVTPNPYDARATGEGILHDPAGRALSAVSELVTACEGLPNFDTFQILCVPTLPPYPVCWCGWHRCGNRMLHVKQWKQSLREQAKCMKDFAIICLKESKTGRQEGERRKRITVRVVRLSSALSNPNYYPGSVEVEEYEV